MRQPGARAIPRTSRRDLLRGAGASIASIALPGFATLAGSPAALAQGDASGAITVTPLADGLTILRGASGSNMLARETSDGLALVDSGAAADRAALLGWLAGNGLDRVAAVFNTHWHPGQVGANAALGAAGAKIVAHEKTRQRLRAGYYLPDEDRYEPALPPEGLPTETFFDEGSTTVGGSRIEHGYLLEAHTDGDIYVAFPDANVIAAGDAIAPAQDPVLDWYGGGWLGGRLDAQERLLEIGDRNTRYVPAFGPVVGRAEVEAEHDMLVVLFDRFVEHIRLGKSARDLFAEGIHAGLGRELADPARLIRDCYEGFWAHHNALVNDIV
jgi:glyoxylase-like metal-dependent hydrolase (beta-lactamase superfamily II)